MATTASKTSTIRTTRKAAPKAKAPVATEPKGCSLKRLQGWATRYGLEIVNGTRGEGQYSIDLANGTEQHTFTGVNARAAHGAALEYIKTLPAPVAEATDEA